MAQQVAHSFLIAEDALGKSLASAMRAVPRASGGLVFACGALARDVRRLAEVARQSCKGVPLVVVPAAGVLSERGEIEGAPGASGILWSGGTTAAFALGEQSQGLPPEAERATAVIAFPRPEAFQPSSLAPLRRAAPRARIFGGGTAGPPAVAVTARGELFAGATAGLWITGLTAPIVDAAHACKPLCDFARIDRASGSIVLEIGGEPALDRLSAAGRTLGDTAKKPQLFAMIAETDELERPRLTVVPVRGIDPTRRGIALGEGDWEGKRIAFGVLDGAAARAELEATATRASARARGAVPRFGLYLSCAGRGHGLYGANDVEHRVLRRRFPELPIAGMQSSFEIAPGPSDVPEMLLYTGVLALFRSPS